MSGITTTIPPTLSADACDALARAGEYFAAGLLSDSGASLPERYAAAHARALMHVALPAYEGSALYPLQPLIWAQPEALFHWHYVAPNCFPPDVRAARIAETADPVLRDAYQQLDAFLTTSRQGLPPGPHQGHGLAGAGWTHSTLQYARILAEGFDGYRARITAAQAATTAKDAQALYRGLLLLLDGFDAYASRLGAYLQAQHCDDPTAEGRRQTLAAYYSSGGLRRPATTFHEALTAVTFCCILDGCDSPGRVDQFLWPYYQRDVAAGRLTEDDARAMLREFWTLINRASGWNVIIGGTTREGAPAANTLTRLCLESVRGMRRPNLALRLRKDTPQEIWDAAFDTLRAGTGIPALYCDEHYLQAIAQADLGVAEEDARDFAFGGCTELMIQGASNVGSVDYDLNVAVILEETLHDALPACPTFEALIEAFLDRYRAEVRYMVAYINTIQHWRACNSPQMIRTLFTDDCIARGQSFQAGGARYNWSVVNIGGLSNVIDSLAAIRDVLYTDAEVTAEALLQALRENFAGHEALRARLQRCPKFGNDHPDVDALAHQMSEAIYQDVMRHTPWRGGKFLPSTLMHVTYASAGRVVGALPDGRLAGEPVADSAGPVAGRDRSGPTAMLRSVTRLKLIDAPGTLVVNVRLATELFDAPEGRQKLKAMLQGYFALGGMQLQVNVVDQAVLRDALAHPERHGDLVIRVGGYSEYFTHLEPAIQHSLLERTEHV